MSFKDYSPVKGFWMPWDYATQLSTKSTFQAGLPVGSYHTPFLRVPDFMVQNPKPKTG